MLHILVFHDHHVVLDECALLYFCLLGERKFLCLYDNLETAALGSIPEYLYFPGAEFYQLKQVALYEVSGLFHYISRGSAHGVYSYAEP